MPNILPFLTPFQPLDLSPLHEAVVNIQQNRLARDRMAQQQRLAEAEMAQRQNIADATNQLGYARVAQSAANADALDRRQREIAAARLGQQDQRLADDVLKDLGAATAEGDLPAIEGMKPRMGQLGMELEQQTEPRQLPPILSSPSGLRLPEPALGQSAPGASAQPVEQALLPGSALPPLRSPAAQPTRRLPSIMPDELRSLYAPPEPVQPAPEQTPTGRFRVVRGGQDLGSMDIGAIQQANSQAASESADAWAAGPVGPGQVREAQKRVLDSVLPAMGREKGIKFAAAQAEAELNRQAAGERALLNREAQGERTATGQSRLANKDEFQVYRYHLDSAVKQHKMPAVIDGEEASRQLLDLAKSPNPVAQSAAIARLIKSMTTGAVSDYETKNVMNAQSVYEDLMVQFNKWVGNPGQSPNFMANVAQVAQSNLSRFQERRLRAAKDAAGAIMRSQHISPANRRALAEQAMADILEISPEEAKASRSGGAPSSAFAMPDGSEPPNLGVTSGRPPRVDEIDPNEEADDLLEE